MVACPPRRCNSAAQARDAGPAPMQATCRSSVSGGAVGTSKNFYRTGARTTPAQNVGIEDALRRPAQIARSDALDEARHIDVRGTGSGAGRVEAVQAAVGLDHGGLRSERRLELAEPLEQFGIDRKRGSAHTALLKTQCFVNSNVVLNWSCRKEAFVVPSLADVPSGAKARVHFAAFAARLKPCPFKAPAYRPLILSFIHHDATSGPY
jgi:hypothetical protein